MSGMFQPEKWKSKDGQMIHELTVNPDYIEPYDIEFHQTIVHEMCHLYQYLFGKPGRSGYHNLEFAEIMKNIGLQTSDTGTPDGFKTGKRMYDYVIDNGPFEKAFQKLQETRFKTLEISAVKKDKVQKSGADGKRSKYTCSCGCNVWGKAGLQIVCKKCNFDFQAY